MTPTGLSFRIKQNPVTAFFIFAFLISWITWFLAVTLAQPNTPLFSFIDVIAGYGPAFSAILVSVVINAKPSGCPITKRLIVFVVVFGVSFACQWLAAFIMRVNFNYEVILFAALSSLIAAYVFSSIYHPRKGAANLMSSLKQVSIKNPWLWIGFFLPFILQSVAALISLILEGHDWVRLGPINLALLIAYYPFIFFFGGGLNEEPGWRGFAVPNMQRRYSPLVAGLIIGIIWSVWHFPLHVRVDFLGGIVSFPFRFVYNVPLGVLFSWLYNRSNGNLFACILLHASYNSASTISGLNIPLISIVLMIIFTVFVAVHDKMWRKDIHVPRTEEQPTNETKDDKHKRDPGDLTLC